MKTVGLIHARLDRSPIGTASRLTESLCDVPVLTRTLRRVDQAKRLDEIVVVCPKDQFDSVRGLIDRSRVELHIFDGPEFPAHGVVPTTRKWALDSWRGGLGNTCFFDEHVHPALGLTIARQHGADAVAFISAESPLIDPSLIDAMVMHQEKNSDAKMVFAQTPPGLSATVITSGLLDELVQTGLMPGWINAYRPDQPKPDMINQSVCYHVSQFVQNAAGRLCSDTRRGFERLARLISLLGDNCSTEQIVRGWNDIRKSESEPWPREIQIECTTDDPHEQTVLRPRGTLVGRRGPIPLELFDKIVSEAVAYDDVVLVLGGFGDPLRHPQFAELLDLCKRAKVLGVAIRTTGVDLSPDRIQAIVKLPVDVVQLMIDAMSAVQYEQLHGCREFDRVEENVRALLAAIHEQSTPVPIVTASLVKARQTFDDLDPFFDHWMRSSGWAILEGYSHYAHQMPDHSVTTMTPPCRVPCKQIRHRCTILADGTVVGCDQDFKGLYAAGRIGEQSLAEIWNGPAMQTLRGGHLRGDYTCHPLCAQCDEWHRP